MESKKWLCLTMALILGMVVPDVSQKTVDNSEILEEPEEMQTPEILEKMQASGISEDSFSYEELKDGTLNITGYSGSDANLIIPAEIEGKKVTSIGISAFKGCNFLQSVKIPNGVTVIEMAAFRECESLTDVVIPESVTSIWDFAFYGCSALENITLPKSVTNMGYSMFGNCKGLRSINIAGNINSIGNNMFYGCENITDIELPGTITSIGEQAFYDCKNLKGIEIPNGVISIGDYAFYSCKSLTEIDIPESVTAIGALSFWGCDSLTKITVSMENHNYTAEDGILYDKNKTELIYCPGAKQGKIQLPDDLKDIRKTAFYGCENVTDIVLPESLTNIERNAFQRCKSLTDIIIPKNVTNIGDSAFYNCTELKSIKITGSVTEIGKETFCWCKNLAEIELPDSLLSIKESAFQGCESLLKINLPSELETIEKNTFNGCYKLTEIQLPASLTKIEECTFYTCSSLKNIKIISGITSIGASAFNGCVSLESIEIPDTVTDIGRFAFVCCNGLKNFEVSETNLNYAAEDGILYNKDKTELILCPGGKNGNITIPSGVTTIRDDAFYYCKSISDIAVPDSITQIESGAFSHCSAEKIELPDGLTVLGDRAFSESGIISIELPDNITDMGEEAFHSCQKLKRVKLPAKITSVPENTFYGCCNLKGIEIPESVTNISIYAFRYCDNLQRVKISSNVQIMGKDSEYEQVFEGCNKEQLTLFVKAGSTAENYAQKYGIKIDAYENYSYPEDTDIPNDPDKPIPPDMPNDPDVSIPPSNPDISETCVHLYQKTIRGATCSAMGEEKWTCIKCGKFYINSLPLKEHSIKTIITKAKMNKNGSIIKKCSKCGTVESRDVINGIKDIELSKNSVTYNGKAQKPSVSVKDSAGNNLDNGSDYTVSFPKVMKNIGKYTVTIHFKDNYTGTAKAVFTIKPNGTSISKLTASSKGFKVKWKKQPKQATGYRIQYSTSKKFTKNTTKATEIKKNRTTSKSIQKLKAGKKYYVRICTYKAVKVSGKKVKIYSDWSKIKNVTTKK